jgi:hypothetical protein
VILVQSNPGVAALRQVNHAIPTVFAQVADPVGSIGPDSDFWQLPGCRIIPVAND